MVFDAEQFRRSIEMEGFSVIENVLDADAVARLKRDLETAIRKEAEYHGTTEYPDYGMVLVCSLYGRSFIDLFDNPLVSEPFDAVLGPGCIVYAYTSSSIPPKGKNYSRRLHVDSPRLIPGYVTNMGMTLTLDDFTTDNGAPWFLAKSHKATETPAEEAFFKKAFRFTAKAGSAIFFNARVWHTSDLNTTNVWRHAVTLNMCRPYMKQRLDIPKLMAGMDLSGVSERALQKLGFHSQVPVSYDEYYAPREKRKYRQKAE